MKKKVTYSPFDLAEFTSEGKDFQPAKEKAGSDCQNTGAVAVKSSH
jgi:hypothetical protein